MDDLPVTSLSSLKFFLGLSDSAVCCISEAICD